MFSVHARAIALRIYVGREINGSQASVGVRGERGWMVWVTPMSFTPALSCLLFFEKSAVDKFRFSFPCTRLFVVWALSARWPFECGREIMPSS